ncbi:hypothetical protein BPAE_0051g00140 [Botrytis paeoniae]|uniref:Uncharacterized protein n=1 Tax=Botrytis paeoniae TaxID=278948 RepID=A0A4Z1FVF4_9HELO|nr:hypothetical protein BPAE_0051g00140 [Botrytis paeoniae]
MHASPINASVRAEFQKGAYKHAEFETLQTRLIVPTPEYIAESMNSPNIKTYLGSHLHRKKICMITGLGISSKGTTSQGDHSSLGGNTQLGIPTMPTVSGSLGFSVNYQRRVDEEVTSGAEDFVWAFSLRRIYYHKGSLVKSDVFADGVIFTENKKVSRYEDCEHKPATNDNTKIIVEGMNENDFDAGLGQIYVLRVVYFGNGERFMVWK